MDSSAGKYAILIFSRFFFHSLKIGLLPTDEATLKRLSTYPGVEGIILTNEEGQLHYTSLDNNVTFMLTPKLLAFAEMARAAIRDISPTDNLISLRLRTRHKEVMVVAPKDGIRIIAIQKINLASQIIQPEKEHNDN
jgi:dynein light chain roadblock-type